MSRFIPLLSLLIVAATAVAGDGGPAPAPTPAVPGTGPTAAPSAGFDPSFFVIIIGMILFMWLLVFRPQKKEEAKRKALIDSMKTGHRVVTIGGVHGEVVAVGEGTVDLNVAKGDKPLVMTFNRGAIATNITLAGEAKPGAATK